MLRKRNGDVYAQTNMKINGHWTRVLLHRFIMNPGRGEQVDHRNRDGLDCTRENMRLATHAQNIHNQQSRGGSSRFKGVSWHKKASKWMAAITKDRQWRYLGLHETEGDAARAYDRAARELHGEFALLNFPET